MKRILSVTLSLLMLFSLSACGSSARTEQKVEEKGSLAETGEALGYDLLGYNTSGTTLSFDSTAVVDDDIGQAVYKNGKSDVTLRMTLNEEKFQGLAGYKNAGTAGAIEAPTDVFSKLSIQVVDNSTYFCEFTYTHTGSTCYLSLAETKTNLDLYSVLLIDYVNQLYNMEGTPNFVNALNPDLGKGDESAEASASQESSAQQPEQTTEPEPEPDEEQVTEEKTEEETEEPAEEEPAQEEKTQEEPAEEEKKTEEKSEKKSEEKSEEKTEKKSEEKTEKQSKEKTEEKKSEEKKKKSEGSITLTYYDITLVNVGDAYKFEPKGGSGGYTWKSADKSVASVSKDGTVKAEGKGTTTVTVTSKDGLSAEVIVRVPGK